MHGDNLKLLFNIM